MPESKRDPMGLLGSIVKDVQTSFEGSARAVRLYAYGCEHIIIQPTDLTPEGTIKDACAFDEARIELVREIKVAKSEVKRPNYELGNHVKDKLTGIEGFVSSITIWLGGQSPEYGIEPFALKPNGTPQEVVWLFESRINLVEPIPPKTAKKARKQPGAPGGVIRGRAIG